MWHRETFFLCFQKIFAFAFILFATCDGKINFGWCCRRRSPWTGNGHTCVGGKAFFVYITPVPGLRGGNLIGNVLTLFSLGCGDVLGDNCVMYFESRVWRPCLKFCASNLVRSLEGS